MSSDERPGEPRGWVLYDGECGVCTRAVEYWTPTIRACGYAIAPLQSGWVRERLGMGDEELVKDIRLLLADGGVVNGPDVYRHFMRRIWWMWPGWVLSRVPGLGAVFNGAYYWFVRNRHRFSRACGPGEK